MLISADFSGAEWSEQQLATASGSEQHASSERNDRVQNDEHGKSPPKPPRPLREVYRQLRRERELRLAQERELEERRARCRRVGVFGRPWGLHAPRGWLPHPAFSPVPAFSPYPNMPPGAYVAVPEWEENHYPGVPGALPYPHRSPYSSSRGRWGRCHFLGTTHPEL